jgi:hypothetical protein
MGRRQRRVTPERLEASAGAGFLAACIRPVECLALHGPTLSGGLESVRIAERWKMADSNPSSEVDAAHESM